MHVSGHLCGGTGQAISYQASATLSVAGVPVMAAAVASSDIGGVVIAAPSALNQHLMGLTLDTSETVSATADLADVLVKVDIRPDAIYRAKLSGSSTADTAITAQSASSVSSGGITANITSLDDGAIWGYKGANMGQPSLRRADDTSGGVSISFDNAVASGDEFLIAPIFPGGQGIDASTGANKFCDLTSDSSQVDASVTVTDTDNFVLVEMEARDESGEGTTNSWYLLVSNNHVFGSGGIS